MLLSHWSISIDLSNLSRHFDRLWTQNVVVHVAFEKKRNTGSIPPGGRKTGKVPLQRECRMHTCHRPPKYGRTYDLKWSTKSTFERECEFIYNKSPPDDKSFSYRLWAQHVVVHVAFEKKRDTGSIPLGGRKTGKVPLQRECRMHTCHRPPKYGRTYDLKWSTKPTFERECEFIYNKSPPNDKSFSYIALMSPKIYPIWLSPIRAPTGIWRGRRTKKSEQLLDWKRGQEIHNYAVFHLEVFGRIR